MHIHICMYVYPTYIEVHWATDDDNSLPDNRSPFRHGLFNQPWNHYDVWICHVLCNFSDSFFSIISTLHVAAMFFWPVYGNVDKKNMSEPVCQQL